jgi:hypothetical protein
MSETTLKVELPDEVARVIEEMARERGVTPSDIVAGAAAEKVGAVASATAYFSKRAKSAKSGDARRFFTRAGGEPPRSDDERE